MPKNKCGLVNAVKIKKKKKILLRKKFSICM